MLFIASRLLGLLDHNPATLTDWNLCGSPCDGLSDQRLQRVVSCFLIFVCFILFFPSDTRSSYVTSCQYTRLNPHTQPLLIKSC